MEGERLKMARQAPVDGWCADAHEQHYSPAAAGVTQHREEGAALGTLDAASQVGMGYLSRAATGRTFRRKSHCDTSMPDSHLGVIEDRAGIPRCQGCQIG